MYGKPMRKGSRFARRAFVTGAATDALCGAGVLADSSVVPDLEQRVGQATLGELEGVSIDAALQAAEITRAAVQVIDLAVARLVAALGGGALGLLLSTIEAAHNALAFVHASTDTVDRLHAVVASWQAGLGALPIALNAYATADITSAETNLRALKKMIK